MRKNAELVWFEQRNGFSAGNSVAQEQALAQTYTAQAKAAGFKVWICTPPPTADAHAAKIQDYSAWLRANHNFADGFIDLNAVPAFTPAGDIANPTNYFDAVHLNATGYGVLASTVFSSIK